MEAADASADFAGNRFLAQIARSALDLFFEIDDPSLTEYHNVLTYYWEDQASASNQWNEVVEMWKKGELNSPEFRLQFEEMTRRQLPLKLRNATLSELAAMNPFSQSAAGSEPFVYKSPQFFLEEFMGGGGFGYVSGNPGTGKTSLVCTFMEMCPQVKLRVVTNIRILDPPPHIFMTRSFKQTMVRCIDNLTEGYLTLLVNDELGQYLKKKRAMSTGYVNMESMLFLLRKVGGNELGIVQRPEDLASVVMDFSTIHFQKTKRDAMIVRRGGMTK